MPFIKPQEKITKVDLNVKIDPAVRTMVDQYAASIDSELAYVVQEILRRVLKKETTKRKASGKTAKAA